MKILITGANGLIGREVIGPLWQNGFDIHAVTTKAHCPDNRICWHTGSLFDFGFLENVFRRVKPDFLLNLAWKTTGDYLTSPVNFQFLNAGKNLAELFVRYGGSRAIYVGSCFEYKFKSSPLKEADELYIERNLYTRCKDELRRHVSAVFSSHNVSFAYGRIFYVFGRNEDRTRLTGMLINNLQKGILTVIKSGPLRKDYIYAKDVGFALSKIIQSDVVGEINISTGKSVTIRDFALALGSHFHRHDLIKFEDNCMNQPPLIVGDNTKLVREVGFTPLYDIETAFSDIILHL